MKGEKLSIKTNLVNHIREIVDIASERKIIGCFKVKSEATGETL